MSGHLYTHPIQDRRTRPVLLDPNPLHVDSCRRSILMPQRVLRLDDTARGLVHPPGKKRAVYGIDNDCLGLLRHSPLIQPPHLTNTTLGLCFGKQSIQSRNQPGQRPTRLRGEDDAAMLRMTSS